MSTTAQPVGPRPARAPRRPDRITALKTLLWIACLAPAANLAWRAYNDDLTANPIELITLETGF